MLNKTNINLGPSSTEVNFNTTSTGHLQKSNSNSIFIDFHLTSTMSKWVFSINETPYLMVNNKKKK